MRRFLSIAFLLALATTSFISGQTKSDVRDMFLEAESFVLFEEYNEALPFYLDLLKLFPDNANYKYRIGQCYLNMPGEKEKALGYLEEAVKAINPKHKEGRIKEQGAPWDAWYYLANAYRITNDLDKAIETYKIFSANINPAVYDTTIINLQIESCRNAKMLMASPLYIKQINMGNTINDRFSDFNPVVSSDEKTIVYTRKLPFYVGVFYSKKVNGQWSEPIDMTPQLGVDNDFYSASLSADGNSLLLYKTDDYTGNIYISRFENNRWNGITKLNENICTKFWESHASMTSDGQRIYFSSNRKGGYGGLDIYYADLDSTGNWGIPVNLGETINTPYNEDTPFLTSDNKTLYFSSRGHFNMGGYDIFYSSLQPDNSWSVPMNVGYPINTTDDDLFFSPVGEGYRAYLAKFDEKGYGLQDIFAIEIFSESNPRKFFVRGIVSIKDLTPKFRDSIKVSALSKKDPNSLVVVYSNPKTGEYQLELAQGDYQLAYEAEGTRKLISDVKLPLNYQSDTFLLSKKDLDKSDFSADMKLLEQPTIDKQGKGDSLEFVLETEPRSVLRIQTFKGDSLISSEERIVMSNTTTVKTPSPDTKSNVVFTLTDRFGNETMTTVELSGRKESTKIAPPVYASVIARKQVNALLQMLEKHADNDLKKVIRDSDPSKKQFAKADDLIDYLKEAATAKGIDPAEVDVLALKVALYENILTQSAVDLMAANSAGEIQESLGMTDIYEAKIKTFSELGRYLENSTGGSVTSRDLSDLAKYILMDPEPGIDILREKFRVVSQLTPFGSLITQSSGYADSLKLKLTREWMASFTSDIIENNIGNDNLSLILASVTVMAEETPEELIEAFRPFASGQFSDFLNELIADGKRMKTSDDVMSAIAEGLSAGSFTDRSATDALAGLILSRDKSESDIAEYFEREAGKAGWLIYPGAGLVILILLFYLRKKKKKEE